MTEQSLKVVRVGEIGTWWERKHQIVREYAVPNSAISIKP